MLSIYQKRLIVEIIKMKRNKREVNIEVLVGLFVSGALVALGIFTIVLGGTSLLKTQYQVEVIFNEIGGCLLYTSPSPRDATLSRMPSSA